jgi:hypothetical protein
MEFDAFHHWLLLRPLFVFIMALPLLIAVFLVGAKQNRREKNASQKFASSAPNIASAKIDTRSEDGKELEATAVTRPSGEHPIEQPVAVETAYSNVKMPREWDGGPLRPNLNRQVRLGGGRSGGGLR